jgi:hypothetical protein
MRRRLALYLLFALFGAAYATHDRVPRSVLSVLRGGAEHVERVEQPQVEGRRTDRI